MWPLGPSRVDAIAWGAAVGLALIGTLIAWAMGARLGAALTLGVIILIVVVIAWLIVDARGHGQNSLPAPGDD